LVEVPLLFWVLFHLAIICLIVYDLMPKKKEPTLRRNILWSILIIGIAISLGGYVYLNFGQEEGIKYVTAYVTELALSVDNLFVFIVIFGYFGVPFAKQHKPLLFGILGAIILRAAFIFAGIELIESFSWVIYVFGAFLLYSSYKLLRGGNEATNPGDNSVVRLAKRLLPISEEYHDDKFMVKIDGALKFTPLLIVLLVIETTDIMFALDSVPAVLTITGEFFTAYTSNIMAILGLRALYFVVAHAMGELKYLSKGLALVLAYLGVKTFATLFGIEVPILLNMGIVLGTIGFFIIISLVFRDKKRCDHAHTSRIELS
jgi:tellurite resistance protein TerC